MAYKNKESARIYNREYWHRERKVKIANDPEQARRVKARLAAKYALKIGKIQRQPCTRCGAVKAEMHHDDYSKPLQIEWLCRPCHKAEHPAIKGQRRKNLRQQRKLTDEDVRQMRDLKGLLPYRVIAKQYGVTYNYTRQIMQGTRRMQ